MCCLLPAAAPTCSLSALHPSALFPTESHCRRKIVQMQMHTLQTSQHDLAFNWIMPMEPGFSCPCRSGMLSHCSAYKQQQLGERLLSGGFLQQLSKLGPGLYAVSVMLEKRVSWKPLVHCLHCELFRAVPALSRDAGVLPLHTADKRYLCDEVLLAMCACPWAHGRAYGASGQRFPSWASAQRQGWVPPCACHGREPAAASQPRGVWNPRCRGTQLSGNHSKTNKGRLYRAGGCHCQIW